MRKHAPEKLAMTRHRGSVQKRFVDARCIHDHILCLASDASSSYAFVNILAVEGISYDLKSSEEQLLLNEQFQALLAGLAYPLQILWRVLPLNIEEYLDQLTFLPERGEEAEGVWPLISSSHATFLHELGKRRTLLKRAIYLIIRVDGKGKPQSRAQRLMNRKRRLRWIQQLEHARQELDLRSSELMRQLNDMNLFVKRLRGEQELTPFYYSCLTPAKADRFPLPSEVIAALDRPIQTSHVASRPFVQGQEKALMVVAPGGHPEQLQFHSYTKDTGRRWKKSGRCLGRSFVRYVDVRRERHQSSKNCSVPNVGMSSSANVATDPVLKRSNQPSISPR